MMPQAGGQYVYLREAYSPLWGFLYGWTLFLVIQTGSIAAVAVAFAKYLGVLIPSLGTEPRAGARVLLEAGPITVTAGHLVAVAIVIFLTLLNCRGVQGGKWVQNIFTVSKTLALIVLIIVGLTVAFNWQSVEVNTRNWWEGIKQTERFREVAAEPLISHLPGLAALMVVAGTMTGSLFSADAWNNVTFTAGEVKNPRRNLPLSLAVGTGIVIALYLLANLAYLASLPLASSAALEAQVQPLEKEIDELEGSGQREAADTAREKLRTVLQDSTTFERGIAHALDDRVATAVMEEVSPRLGVLFMAVAIMVSTFGCVNGMILMGARLYYAMAQDRLFFQAVGRLNRFGVPATGLFLQGIWSILLIFSGTYNQLLAYVMFAALLFYVLTVIGLFVLRRKRPAAERPYRAFGYPVVPALYVILCAVIMLDLLIVKPIYTWPGLIIVLAGIPVYFLWKLSGRPTV